MLTNYKKLILIANDCIKAVKSHCTVGSTNKQADLDKLSDYYMSFKCQKLEDANIGVTKQSLKPRTMYLKITSKYPSEQKYCYSVDDHPGRYELHYKYLDHNNNLREVNKILYKFWDKGYEVSHTHLDGNNGKLVNKVLYNCWDLRLVETCLNETRCYTHEASNLLITRLNNNDKERKEFLLTLYKQDPDNLASERFCTTDIATTGGFDYRFLYLLNFESGFMPYLSQEEVKTWQNYAIRAAISQASKLGNCGSKSIWLLYYLSKQEFYKNSLPSLHLELVQLKEIDHVFIKLSCKKNDVSTEIVSIFCDPWLEEVFSDDIESFDCFAELLQKIKLTSGNNYSPTVYEAEDQYLEEFNRREFPAIWNNKYYHSANSDGILSFELFKEHANDFIRLVNMQYSIILNYNSRLYQTAYAALSHLRDYLDNTYAIPLTWMRDLNSKIYWDKWKFEYEANHQQKLARGYGAGALIHLPKFIVK